MKKSDLIALLSLGALWGASFLFMRMGADQFGGMALAGLRAIGAALCSLPLLASRERLAEMRRHWRPIAVVGMSNSALPFVLFSTVSFVGGAAFSHYVVFPAAWTFFASFNNDYMQFMPKISEAFGLYSYMMLAFAVIFQMPTLVLALARMGVVTAGFLWRHTKYAILIIFILAAVITPSSDVVNQTLMAGPMIALYLLSIIIAWVFGKKRRTSDSD